MSTTYRLSVIGSIVSSFLAGFHLPALHDMVEHGAEPPWTILILTVFFAAAAIVGGWTLLRAPEGGGNRT